ncbi:MAG TPA: hypothetical protein VIZ20_21665 [Streptosporangiaceae bacterium]
MSAGFQNIADDPRPGLSPIASGLHRLAGEAEYQASRVDKILSE